MSAFTPGPWEAVSHVVRQAHPPHDGVEIATCSLHWPKGEPEANARLIAAAPELLRALTSAQAALRSYEFGNASPDLAESIADHVAAVINKAEGR